MMSTKKYDTIVVGGGIAGLTSAAYLAKAGNKVLLIEKNAECGGLVNSFKRNGFQFDAGVRALEDAGIIFPMLADLGIELEVVKSPVSVGVGKDILNIRDIDSLYEYGDLLIKQFPESKEDVHQFIRIVRKIMKHMDVLYGIENPVFKDLFKDRGFLFKKLLPWLPKFLFTVGKINRMNMPIEDYLKPIIKDRALRDVVAQHFFKNTPTFFALSYFTLYLDYFYPKGGVGKLADALIEKIVEWGGEILTETTIVKVDALQKTVKDGSQNIFKFDHLIWAADLKAFYTCTEISGLDEKVKTHFQKTKHSMMQSRGGDSVFSIFLQVDEPLERFAKIATGHFFYTPSKAGLGETNRSELAALLKNWDHLDKADVLRWMEKFTALNTYEISIPGLKDPDLVPEGKSGVVISFLAEFDLFAKVRKDGWYDEFMQLIEKQVVKVVSDSVYPMLKDKIIRSFSFSPLSIANRINSSEGAIVGWTFERKMPVINKIQLSARSVLTPIPSIYQAGQWAYSPAGVPMSILTGKMAADKVLK